MNTPINQVILGNNPLYFDDFDTQLANLEMQKTKLQQLRNMQGGKSKLVWDDINAEISSMTDSQKDLLLQNKEYFEIYSKLQEMVQIELVNLVKAKIENTVEGKDLLEDQLKTIKKLKKQIIEDTNKEMEVFKRFKEYSKLNPGITYEEFIKLNT